MPEKLSIAASLEGDEGYDRFEEQVRDRVARLTGPFFETDATPEALWDAWLSGFPGHRRQHYHCSACRRFIQRYGGLVTIDDQGGTAPAVWTDAATDFFRPSVEGLRRLVARAKVTGVFLSAEPVWGTPTAGGWTHLSGPSPRVYAGRVKTAAQEMAEKREDHAMLSRGLADYPKAVVDQALRVLKADALDRGEKTLGVAEWLSALHAGVGAFPARRSNLVWAAVATAPPGFCHVRSTMISTLLDDVASRLPFDTISRRWAEKMHPLKYRRPSAPPSAGTIEQAERLVEKLGVAPSLARRFARLDDVPAKLWAPPASEPDPAPAGGVFGHLRRGARAPFPGVELPQTPITWEKFRRTILPAAAGMEVLAPGRGNYYALVTAAAPDAPAIIQWDGLEGHPRNPASVYVYVGGSPASQWGLSPGWAKVNAVFLTPAHWQAPERFGHHGQVVHFAVEGARDTRTSTLALFPEILKAEFHGIRSVIEAHSRAGAIRGVEAGDANGLAFTRGSPVTVRVRTPEGVAGYVIDRFD